MIIDIHAHFTAPNALYAYKANLLASRGWGQGRLKLSDDAIVAALNQPVHDGTSHLQQLEEVGTDVQIISLALHERRVRDAVPQGDTRALHVRHRKARRGHGERPRDRQMDGRHAPLIESISWLSDADNKKIFSENARQVLN